MKVKALALGALLLTLPALAEQKVQTNQVAPLVSYEPDREQYADLIAAKLVSHLTPAGVSVVEGDSALAHVLRQVGSCLSDLRSAHLRPQTSACLLIKTASPARTGQE